LSAIAGSGGLKVAVSLAAGRTFHDGSPVTANDVKACLDFIKAHADSPYSAGLSAVASVQATGSLTLEITLSQPNDWLAYDLTFPVLPAASLKADALALIPGTGVFQMASYARETGLTLTRHEPTGDIASLNSIQVLEFASLSEAMKAFEEDRIDLVNLPPEEYSRYILRDSLRFEPYTSSRMVFLAYNTSQKHPLADASRLLDLKQLSAAAREAASAGGLGEGTGTPLLPSSYLLAGSVPDEQAALGQLGAAEWKAFSGTLVLAAPEGDASREKVAGILGGLLDQAGIRWQLKLLAAPEFAAALADGSYDVAILAANVPAQPDPAWLYADSRPAAFAFLDRIAGQGLEGFADWRQRLAASTALAAMQRQPDRGVMAENLVETAARSPWSVLLTRYAAILYGDRVIGQCTPDRYNPYEGIEELWIWSGQSS
jgi:ABC-type transport system substrate-binding protein